jgi:hypothetical protein
MSQLLRAVRLAAGPLATFFNKLLNFLAISMMEAE